MRIDQELLTALYESDMREDMAVDALLEVTREVARDPDIAVEMADMLTDNLGYFICKARDRKRSAAGWRTTAIILALANIAQILL